LFIRLTQQQSSLQDSPQSCGLSPNDVSLLMYAVFACFIKALHALLLLAGRFMVGQACLLLWSVWAWSQRRAAAVAIPNSGFDAGPAAIAAADPFMSLLLAALPLTAQQLSLAAILLPAALYEGSFGAAAVALLSGRWAAWLLLWELWLWCCYVNCGSRCSQKAEQPGQAHAAAAYDSRLTCSLGQQQQQQQLGAQQKVVHSRGSNSKSSSRPELLLLLSRPVVLGAVQLLLPVCMAVVAVWR
jgi:hypothetical protein